MDGIKLKYFVLKPKGTSAYAIASRSAMLEYAKSIEPYNQKLANDLTDWVERELAKLYDPAASEDPIP